MVLLESLELEYGRSIKNFNLPDTVSGKIFSNKDLNKEITIIAFICNHCPYVVRIIEDFSKLASQTSNHVDWIAISSNDPDYREEDSPENMKLFAEKYNFSFPYLYDENQEVAKAFDAICTPDIFVYKKNKLAYHARFEDLKRAIEELSNADSISFKSIPSAGCSIKWKD
jgi:peroxiredoxin